MVKRYVENLPETAQKLMDAFWPGSLTIILPIKPGLLPDAVTGKLFQWEKQLTHPIVVL